MKVKVGVSNRHIHMTKEIQKEENFKNDDIVSVKLSDNTIIDNVHIKISIGDYPELHIDTVDSKEYKLFTRDNVEILRIMLALLVLITLLLSFLMSLIIFRISLESDDRESKTDKEIKERMKQNDR